MRVNRLSQSPSGSQNDRLRDVNRQDMTGTERTFANAYVPGEDIIRYNRASKVYDVKVGDYALVTAKNHEENEITVHSKTDANSLTTRNAFQV